MYPILPLIVLLHLGLVLSQNITLPPLRILPLGDSLTFGKGSTHLAGYRLPLYNLLSARYPRTSNSSFSFIGSLQSGNVLPSTHRHHEGHSGWEIGPINMAARPNYILKPNIVLLMAGTNNIVKSKSESSAPIDLQRLLGDLLDEIPYVTVLVGTLPPLVRKDEWEERRLRYNRELQRVVNKLRDDGEKVEVADMYEVKKRMVLKDGIHINDHAYDIMAEAWVRAIEDAVEKRWISPLETEGTRGVDEVGRAWTVMKLGVIILLLAGLAGVARRGMFGAVARYKLVPQSASSSVRNFLQATGTWESE